MSVALLVACAGPVPASAPPVAAAPRVFVEAALAQLDAAELARARSSSLDSILAEGSLHVLSTLGGLAEPDVPLIIAPDAPAQPHSPELPVEPVIQRFEVTPALGAADALELDLKVELSAAGARHSLRKAEHFSEPQLSVWDTQLATGDGEHIVLLIQPALIRDPDDLRAILERRRGSAPARH